MLATVLDVIAVGLLGAGLLLATLGLVGMLRMSAIHDQLHAAGLITGPAVILILLAALASGNTEIITSAVLVALFVAVTAPLSGHAIAQAAYRTSPERAERRDDDVPGEGLEPSSPRKDSRF